MRISRPPRSSTSLIVGSAMDAAMSSVILRLSSSGTLKSTRIRTRLPLRPYPQRFSWPWLRSFRCKSARKSKGSGFGGSSPYLILFHNFHYSMAAIFFIRSTVGWSNPIRCRTSRRTLTRFGRRASPWSSRRRRCRTVRIADDVAGDDRVLGVFQNALQVAVGAAFFIAALTSSTVVTSSARPQVHDSEPSDWDAQGDAVQLALELRDDLADGAGGAGRGGDDVQGGGAGAAQVLVRDVQARWSLV